MSRNSLYAVIAVLAVIVVGFGIYFLYVRKDPKAFVEWLKLVRLGQQEKFFRK